MISEFKEKQAPGEKAAIRFFDSENSQDMTRLRRIISHSEVKDRMDSVAGMSKRDMYDWADEKGAYGRYYLFAVSGTKDVFGESSVEVGQVQGFVYFYAGSEERKIVERIVKTGFVKDAEVGEKRIFEISFAKLPGSPGGQISSAVRQACIEIRKMDRAKGGTGVFIFCFVDETNEGSIRVVESCGFERRGKHFYEEDSKELSALYVLKFGKLLEIEKRKSGG